ncbi:hypothetical protein ACP70R_014543 [Stipagrostis hirtigluma subsp. patula]
MAVLGRRQNYAGVGEHAAVVLRSPASTSSNSMSSRAGIARVTSVARIKDPKLPTDVNRWKITSISKKKVPRQDDGSSCGYFLLHNLENWDGSKMRSNFTQEDANILRKKLLAELLFSETNKEESTKEAIRRIMEANNPPEN